MNTMGVDKTNNENKYSICREDKKTPITTNN